ncbi:MAG: hypothetical protein K6F88_00260, partial [Ruminococcus sp.]|nr:hypothetical protein [Ruminococcus sp.]
MNYTQMKYLRDNITRLKGEIEVVQSELTKITPTLSDMPKSQYVQGNIDDLIDIKIKLEESLRVLEAERDKGIESIPDTTTGTMLKLRMCYLYSYRRIATCVFDDPTKEDAVRMRIHRAEW